MPGRSQKPRALCSGGDLGVPPGPTDRAIGRLCIAQEIQAHGQLSIALVRSARQGAGPSGGFVGDGSSVEEATLQPRAVLPSGAVEPGRLHFLWSQVPPSPMGLPPDLFKGLRVPWALA